MRTKGEGDGPSEEKLENLLLEKGLIVVLAYRQCQSRHDVSTLERAASPT